MLICPRCKRTYNVAQGSICLVCRVALLNPAERAIKALTSFGIPESEARQIVLAKRKELGLD